MAVAFGANAQLTGATAVTWLVGIGLLVTLLEFTPKLGGALLTVIVVYLALQFPKRGVV